MRREQLERIRRHAAIEECEVPNWGTVFLRAVRDTNFWNSEVRDRALLYLCRIKTRAETVDDGTAQPLVASAGFQSQAYQPARRQRGGSWTRQRNTPYSNPQGYPVQQPPAQPGGTAAPASNANEFCNSWNAGRCVPNGPCPNGRRHTCSLCGGADHPAGHKRLNCPRNTNPPSRGIGQGPKGNAKGKGKGKSKTKSK